MDKLKTVGPIITQDTRFCRVLNNIPARNANVQRQAPVMIYSSSDEEVAQVKKVEKVRKITYLSSEEDSSKYSDESDEYSDESDESDEYTKKRKTKKIMYDDSLSDESEKETPYISDSDFWKLVQRLNWVDKSDRICNKYNMRGISKPQRVILQNEFSCRMGDLSDSLDNISAFSNLSLSVQCDVINHIIAKGKDFYIACVTDCSWAEFIIEGKEYQKISFSK